MIWKLVAVGAGLSIGNFVYQCFGPADWSTALERSYFQLFALFAFGVTLAIADAAAIGK